MELLRIIKANLRLIPSVFLLLIIYALISQIYFTNDLPNILNQAQIQNLYYIQESKIALKEQQQLKNKLHKIVNGFDTLESNARYQLGFIKKGEKYYNFP